MNSRALVVGFISIVVFGAFLFKGKGNDDEIVPQVQSNTSTTGESVTTGLGGKVKSMGAVEVEVTPINMEPGSNMTFDIALNTHSVELDYDYENIIKAEDDKGNVYDAVDWSGGASGHHLSGELVFDELSENATQVQLIIDGIDNEKSVFEWNL